MRRDLTDEQVLALAVRDDHGKLAGSCNTCALAVFSRCTAEGTEAWREKHLYPVEVYGIVVLHVVPHVTGMYPCARRVRIKRIAKETR